MFISIDPRLHLQASALSLFVPLATFEKWGNGFSWSLTSTRLIPSLPSFFFVNFEKHFDSSIMNFQILRSSISHSKAWCLACCFGDLFQIRWVPLTSHCFYFNRTPSFHRFCPWNQMLSGFGHKVPLLDPRSNAEHHKNLFGLGSLLRGSFLPLSRLLVWLCCRTFKSLFFGFSSYDFRVGTPSFLLALYIEQSRVWSSVVAFQPVCWRSW